MELKKIQKAHMTAVTVKLRGGLGNQLFQYASGLALSRRLEVPLKFSLSLLPASVSHAQPVSRWPEQISSFDHFGVILDRRMRGKALEFASSRGNQAIRFLGDLFPRTLGSLGHFANEATPRLEIFDALTSPVTINSYCTDPRLFASYEEEIRRSIKSIRQPSEWYTKTLEECRIQKPIGVHVRLGDYKNLSHIYGKPRLQYIALGLDYFRNAFPASPVWLFSDEPDQAFNILAKVAKIDRTVVTPADSKPLESLLIMSECKAFIGTNSTFSWWAAYLGHRDGNTAMFPRPLYLSGAAPEPKHYLLDTWLQLGGG